MLAQLTYTHVSNAKRYVKTCFTSLLWHEKERIKKFLSCFCCWNC